MRAIIQKEYQLCYDTQWPSVAEPWYQHVIGILNRRGIRHTVDKQVNYYHILIHAQEVIFDESNMREFMSNELPMLFGMSFTNRSFYIEKV